jgi:shikimate dehydrogenase
MTDRYVVAGNPVAHSKSPLIHARFAAQTGQDMEYRRLLVQPGCFAEAARRFFEGGGRGMNVTVPFKEDAARFADELAPRAARAGAVNTLVPVGNRILGDNTDGTGLLRDLQHNLGWPVRDQRVLLVGAGGAARGALGPLLAARPAALFIVNRTSSRARALASDFAADGPVTGGGFESLAGSFDLLVNASSAGLHGEAGALPPGTVAPGARCYDMVYGDAPTPFLRWARDAGAAAIADGLGMLVEQAAEAFYLWRGVRPDTAPVIAQLRGGIRVREAEGAADMAAAARLFREYQAWLGADLCFQGFEQELASLPGRYAPPGGALFLAESAGEAFACVAVRGLDADTCEMKRLYVPEGWRGTGLGRRLAGAAIAAARRAGYRRMRLDTLERLREANALYQSLGFRRCAPYYANPLEGVVYWELDLAASGPVDEVTP